MKEVYDTLITSMYVLPYKTDVNFITSASSEISDPSTHYCLIYQTKYILKEMMKTLHYQILVSTICGTT